jgi:hypothetical protein
MCYSTTYVGKYLHNKQSDGNEGDEDSLDEEYPFALDGGRAELADAVRDLLDGGGAEGRQVFRVVN